MKKMTALWMMIVLVFSLVACGNTSSDSSAPTSTTDGKTLVVYYSASGNTERVAKDIAETAGADMFENANGRIWRISGTRSGTVRTGRSGCYRKRIPPD